MRIKQLFTEDEAVSSVIGILLLVAITVVLAAVMGSYVLDLGDQAQNPSPQASFIFDFSEDETKDGSGTQLEDGSDGGGVTAGDLTITHGGGVSIPASQLTVTDGSEEVAGTTFSADPVATEDSVTVVVDSEDTVRLTWSSENGKQTATLGKWTGPDA